MVARKRILKWTAIVLGALLVVWGILVATNEVCPEITEFIFPEAWFPFLFKIKVIGTEAWRYYDNGRMMWIIRYMPRKDRPRVRGSGRYYQYGESVCISPDGKERLTLHWPNATGKWVEYTNAGTKLRELEYKDGKQHGLEINWDVGGWKSSERHYENGLLNGDAFAWDENGRKCAEVGYRNGEPHGRCLRWYENGNPQFEEFYDNGEPTGTWRSWSPDGKLAATLEFPNANGRWVEWYMGATRRREENYVNGKLHGKRSMYDESSGKLLEEQWWNHGELLKEPPVSPDNSAQP